MKTKLTFISILLFLLSQTSFSQTVIQEGEVYGNWTKSSSPYLIQGEINIPADKTLTIEPGVVVKFEGYYAFNIYGSLIAEGAVGDSIVFTTDDHDTGWHGLRFQQEDPNIQPDSKLLYCVVEYGKATGSCPENRGGGIYVLRSNLIIANCCIRNNRSVAGAGEWGGGGIYCEYTSAIIDNNLITDNYTDHDGGGIYCNGSSPVISNNRITNNEAGTRGGGIATFLFASPEIWNNVISNNHADLQGGGIYQSGGESLIHHNVIIENRSSKGGGIGNYLSDDQQIYNNLITDNEASNGGGIWNKGTGANIFNNTIVRNTATFKGGGMKNIPEQVGPYIYKSDPFMVNNILYFNTANEGVQIYSMPDNTPVLWYNDIEGLAGDGIAGDIDEQEGNIDIAPGFDNEAEHDCELLGSSVCIDNGINSLADLELPAADILGNVRIWDGNDDGQQIVDMGAYEYGSSPLGVPGIQAGTNNLNLLVSPNPFNDIIYLSFNLSTRQKVIISVRDPSGKQLKMLSNGSFEPGQYKVGFNLGSLASGIYLLNLETDKGIVDSKKIIKISR